MTVGWSSIYDTVQNNSRMTEDWVLYRYPRLDVLIDSSRVDHVPKHDLAHLKRRLTEADFENFDVSTLESWRLGEASTGE